MKTVIPSLVNERKYTAHGLDSDRALTIVGHFCGLHPEYPRGTVNSIYFDTPHLSTYKEKIEGDTQKRKYRFRWYNVNGARREPTAPAFLEIKYRYGSARDKLRLTLSVDPEWIATATLDDPALVRLLYDHAGKHEDHIPLNLIPVIGISYDRHRFVCPQSGHTVCVDVNIRAGRMNPNVLPGVNPFDLNTVVCEFKSSGLDDLPWAQSLYHAGFRIRSFSKYGECINQIMHGGAPTVIRMSI